MTWDGAPASPFPDPGSAAQVFWACLETQVGRRQAGLEFGPGSLTLKPFFFCVHSFLTPGLHYFSKSTWYPAGRYPVGDGKLEF